MENGLEMYKAFIDGLVERKDSVRGKWILGNGYPNTDENRDINELLSMLSNEQKRIIVQMVIEARESGIHDTLVYMNEMMDYRDLVLSQKGEPYPYDHFDSMYYDFIARCAGNEWPE